MDPPAVEKLAEKNMEKKGRKKKSTGQKKKGGGGQYWTVMSRILIQNTVSNNSKVSIFLLKVENMLNFVAHLTVQYICFQRSKNRRLEGFGRKEDILDSEI